MAAAAGTAVFLTFQPVYRAVAWMVPLSLGDSHRGFAVLGTTTHPATLSAADFVIVG